MTQPTTEYATREDGYLTEYVCKNCRNDVKLTIDDTKTNFFTCDVCGLIKQTQLKKLDNTVKCFKCVYWRSSMCPEKGNVDLDVFFADSEQKTLCSGRYFEKRKINYKKKRVSSVINPILLAKDIMGDYTFVIEKQSRILFVYEPETGLYSELAEERIKREIAKRLDENARKSFFNDVHFYIKAVSPIKPFCDQPELVLCNNGILNILTKDLMPFSPDYFLVNKIPVTYDPEQKIVAIDAFFSEVIGETERKTLQEFLGYCLYSQITFHKALLLVGCGRNGKGVTLNLTTAFLGKENCSSETLQNLCYNRFSTANTYCKLANISADLPSSLIKHTGMFKMIVGGDAVPNERKHVTAYPFNPYAKHLFSANYIPPIANTEDCDAFYARWLIIEYKKQFLGTKADKHLLEKLTTPVELSGLLNWGVDGFQRLIKNKDFTMTENINEMRKQYIKRSNSVQAFIDECIEVTAEFSDFLTSKYLYTKFLDYCNQNQIKTKSQREFIENMKEHCKGTDFKKTRLNNEQKQFFGEDNNTPNAWHYVKFVPCVPQVPTPPTYSKNEMQVSLNIQGEEQKEQEEQAFQSQCFDCRAVLNFEWYEHGGKRFCRQCHLKMEAQKKGSSELEGKNK